MYLSRGVVAGLVLARNQRIRLVRVDQLVHVVEDDARAARVHQRLDAVLPRRAEQVPRAVHVHLAHHLVRHAHRVRACRVNDDVGAAQLRLKQFDQGRLVGNVAVMVGYVGRGNAVV